MVPGADAGMARHVFFVFLSHWDGAPLRLGALRKLHTLRIGGGGNVWNQSLEITGCFG